MQRLIRYILLFACVCASACSESVIEEKNDPELPGVGISGLWVQTAYLCSDGYFVAVNAPDAVHYEFARADENGEFIYTQYTVAENGERDISKQGTWTYDAQTQSAHITEPRGWNLDIHFTFEGERDAILKIKGRTANSSSTVKARVQTK